MIFILKMSFTKWFWNVKNYVASSGNWTRAARVTGEHSTTTPTMLMICVVQVVCEDSVSVKASKHLESIV